MIYEFMAFSQRPLEDIIDGISLLLSLLSVVCTVLELYLIFPSMISAGSTEKTLPVACERVEFYSL